MSVERRVKVFRNGRNLAVRIPREFEGQFREGEDAVMRQEDGCVVLEPVHKKSLLEILNSLETLDEEWPYIDDPPPEDFEL